MEPLAHAVSEDDLEGAAAAVAALIEPGFERAGLERELNRIGAELQQSLGARTGGARARALLRALYRGRGWHAPERYEDDAELNHLGRVLERGRGSPIALAALASCIGARVGVALWPLAFPGHSLLRLGGSAEVVAGRAQGALVDPCTGATPIDEAALRLLAARELGLEGEALDGALAPATSREVAARLLQNVQRATERSSPALHRRAEAELTQIGAQGAIARRTLSLLVASYRAPRDATPRRRLWVHRDGLAFRLDDSAEVDLSRRRALPLLLTRLAAHHLSGARHGLGWAALVEAGWPGERIQADAAWSRVRTSIRTLRKLGLEGVLVTIGSGYLLEPECEVRLG